jgi:hypothetical protein
VLGGRSTAPYSGYYHGNDSTRRSKGLHCPMKVAFLFTSLLDFSLLEFTKRSDSSLDNGTASVGGGAASVRVNRLSILSHSNPYGTKCKVSSVTIRRWPQEKHLAMRDKFGSSALSRISWRYEP